MKAYHTRTLINQVVLESRQVFERQNLASSKQSAAIVDQLIVDGLEHVHIQLRKFKLLQFRQALIRIIKVNAFATWNLVVLGTSRFLRFFITKVVCITDFSKVVHILCSKLHFRIATSKIVIHRYMQRLVTGASRSRHRIMVIRLDSIFQQIAMTAILMS